MTMITPSYLGETIEYSSLHACRSTLEDPTGSTLDAVINRSLFLDADKVQFTSPGQASSLPGPPSREPQRNKVPF